MKNDVDVVLQHYLKLDAMERRQFVFELTEFILAQPVVTEPAFEPRTADLAESVSFATDVWPPARVRVNGSNVLPVPIFASALCEQKLESEH